MNWFKQLQKKVATQHVVILIVETKNRDRFVMKLFQGSIDECKQYRERLGEKPILWGEAFVANIYGIPLEIFESAVNGDFTAWQCSDPNCPSCAAKRAAKWN